MAKLIAGATLQAPRTLIGRCAVSGRSGVRTMSFASLPGPPHMSKLRVHLSTSLDGHVAGPSPRQDDPLGGGGEALHEWAFALAAVRAAHGMEGGAVNASTRVVEQELDGVGLRRCARRCSA